MVLHLPTAEDVTMHSSHRNEVSSRCEHVCKGDIQVKWIAMIEHLADIFMKPLAESLFKSLREQLLGW